MDRIIEKLDHGWWVVSHEQKIMVAEGRIAIWRSGKFRSCGSARTTNRRMAGEPVWLVQLQRRHDMGSVRQVIDPMLGCFNWPDVACNWRSFTDRINTVVTAGMKCIQAKPNGRCCAAIAVSVTTRKSPPALLLPSVAMIRSSSPSIPAIVTVSIQYLPDRRSG